MIMIIEWEHLGKGRKPGVKERSERAERPQESNVYLDIGTDGRGEKKIEWREAE